MRASIFLMLAAAFLCSGDCVQIGPQQYGRVEVTAFSAIGERIPAISVDLVSVGTQKSFKFHDGVAKAVPYGAYFLRVSAAAFVTLRREIYVDQPDVSVRAPLRVFVECGSTAEIGGVIRPTSDRELWVKLVPVIGSGGTEVRVTRLGAFLATNLIDGDYFLMVVDGKKIVHTETVHLPASGPVNVNLSGQ